MFRVWLGEAPAVKIKRKTSLRGTRDDQASDFEY